LEAKINKQVQLLFATTLPLKLRHGEVIKLALSFVEINKSLKLFNVQKSSGSCI